MGWRFKRAMHRGRSCIPCLHEVPSGALSLRLCPDDFALAQLDEGSVDLQHAAGAEHKRCLVSTTEDEGQVSGIMAVCSRLIGSYADPSRGHHKICQLFPPEGQSPPTRSCPLPYIRPSAQRAAREQLSSPGLTSLHLPTPNMMNAWRIAVRSPSSHGTCNSITIRRNSTKQSKSHVQHWLSTSLAQLLRASTCLAGDGEGLQSGDRRTSWRGLMDGLNRQVQGLQRHDRKRTRQAVPMDSAGRQCRRAVLRWGLGDTPTL